MAVPTFTSVTPSTGYTGGGNIVDIVGTNFRAVEHAISIPQTQTVPTVAVTFGGEDTEETWVISDTLLRVRVPMPVLNPNADIKTELRVNPDVSRIDFTPVDIVITNLDNDGNPIGGETVTASGAYTYQQPLIRLPAGDAPLLQVFQKFIQLLKLTVVHRVSVGADTDFGMEGVAISVLSEHPSIGLRLTIEKDDEYSHYDNEKQVLSDGAGKWNEYSMQTTVLMRFDLTVSAEHDYEVLWMDTRLIQMQMASPWLIVPPDPNYPISIPDNKYPLEITRFPIQAGGVNNVNITAHMAQFTVRGVPILLDDPSTKSIPPRSTIYLISTDMDGDNPVTVTV